MNILVTAIVNSADILKWKKQWLVLFREQAEADLSSSFQWLANDFIHLSKDRSRKCYVAHRNGELLGALVCELKTIKIAKIYNVSVIDTGSHFVNDFAFKNNEYKDVIEALFSAVQKNNKHCAWLNFERMTRENYRAISVWASSSSYRVLSSESDLSSVFDVDNTCFEKFVGNLGKKTRNNLRYYRRLIEREVGQIKCEIIKPNSLEQTSNLFELFLTIEKSGWKGEHGTAITQLAASESFHKALCESARQEQQMYWYLLIAGDQVIAMNMVLRRGATLWVVKTAYENAYKRFSPGTVALTELLKAAIENQEITTVRMITNYSWLEKWKPRKESYRGLRIYFPSLAGKLLFIITRCMKKEWKVVKRR